MPTPSYTNEALKAKIKGVIIIEVIILPNGLINPNDIKVIQGLGYGLDEKVIEILIRRWRFNPGTKDGKPVSVKASIEIEFNFK